MTRHDRPHARRLSLVLVVLTAAGAGMVALSSPSSADVSAVKGSAYGYSLSASLFGGPANVRGVGQFPCTAVNTPPGCAPDPAASDSPQVTLAADASNSPQMASQPSVTAQVGPARFFTSGTQTVSTSGTLGPTGSVTSTANIQGITGTQGEVFTADSLASTCTASESGVSASTTVANGILFIDSGDDLNFDDDYTDPGEHPPVTVNIPANPAPNTVYVGHLHVNNQQDNFEYVFNEQIVNPDGSITVYAAHQRLLGPTAIGDLFIGRVDCGVTVTTPSTTTTAPTTTSTTAPTTTSTSTTSTTAPTTTSTSTTSTTAPTTTSTTGPGVTCNGVPATIVGTGGPDALRGTNGPDVIVGLGGDDFILGNGGDDIICGNGGNDRISGGAGNDLVFGGAGSDDINGGFGDDVLRGELGNDRLAGDSGNNLLDGGPGANQCIGGPGTNTFVNCASII
jgi:Ca2+-binding RTX toxin-like protein